jgi:hypothetical protein
MTIDELRTEFADMIGTLLEHVPGMREYYEVFTKREDANSKICVDAEIFD